jgi:tRNA A37 threonylcarbamoyladenosine biosynthesis protein TsaE
MNNNNDKCNTDDNLLNEPVVAVEWVALLLRNLERSQVQISARRPYIWTQIFRVFP